MTYCIISFNKSGIFHIHYQESLVHQENVYCMPSDWPCQTALPALQHPSTQMGRPALDSIPGGPQRPRFCLIRNFLNYMIPYSEIKKSYHTIFYYWQCLPVPASAKAPLASMASTGKFISALALLGGNLLKIHVFLMCSSYYGIHIFIKNIS